MTITPLSSSHALYQFPQTIISCVHYKAIFGLPAYISSLIGPKTCPILSYHESGLSASGPDLRVTKPIDNYKPVRKWKRCSMHHSNPCFLWTSVQIVVVRYPVALANDSNNNCSFFWADNSGFDFMQHLKSLKHHTFSDWSYVYYPTVYNTTKILDKVSCTIAPQPWTCCSSGH